MSPEISKTRAEKRARDCDPNNMKVFMLTGKVPTHFHCSDCNGEYHEECDKAPVEVKHSLHPKHSLQLVRTEGSFRTRECYCCDEDLAGVFYFYLACDFAMNIVCVEKRPVLCIECPEWHEHDLSLFSSQASLTCDICALTHSRCPFYICPPCGFVIHQTCIFLPRVIKISRHPHRITFTPSFNQRDRSCGVCQRKIDNAYGGYSCIRKDCLFAAHSKCATQLNVWDSVDLEGQSEETEEEKLEPFVRIKDGIIQHFSHQQHHLRLDENANRDYDEDKLCQACTTPIYFGNFYSCMDCDFILHEACANIPLKLEHLIHPHTLTLVGAHDGGMNYYSYDCSACPWSCINSFFYKCFRQECRRFNLHVQCATLSEPLVHESHKHPLFLTSKPGDYMRQCLVCKVYSSNPFNCIEDCDSSLCFQCATLPHMGKV